MQFKFRDGRTEGVSFGDLSKDDAFKLMSRNLPIALQNLILLQFGQNDIAEQHQGLTIGFRQPLKLPTFETPLAEGRTPSGMQVKWDVIKSTLKQYGTYVPLTDHITVAFDNDFIKDSTEALTIAGAETLDKVIYGELMGGTAVAYARSASSVGRGDVDRTIAMTQGESHADAATDSNTSRIDLVSRMLSSNNAKTITQMIRPSAEYNTDPVAPAYIAACHPDLVPDLYRLPGFTPVEHYASAQKTFPGEAGKCRFLRFVTSTGISPIKGAGKAYAGTTMKKTSGNLDVYPVFVFGKNAYGVAKMSGYGNFVPLVVNPKPSASDQLGQRGSIGIKTWFAAHILNDDNMVRLEVACSEY